MDSVKAAASFFFFSWFLVSGLVKCMYRSRLASTKNFEVVLVGRCEPEKDDGRPCSEGEANIGRSIGRSLVSERANLQP